MESGPHSLWMYIGIGVVFTRFHAWYGQEARVLGSGWLATVGDENVCIAFENDACTGLALADGCLLVRHSVGGWTSRLDGRTGLD